MRPATLNEPGNRGRQLDLQRTIDEITQKVAPIVGRHAGADYIPGLKAVDFNQFGMAVATVTGEVYGAGNWTTPFSIQSISKVFTLALVLAADGEDIWQRVFREPSGNAFNSLVQLEHEAGIPRNPFINAGALVITDRLHTLTGNASGTVKNLLGAESGKTINTDPGIAASEATHSHRNAALAHLLSSYNNLEIPVETVLHEYIQHCALAMSCRDLAVAARFLASDGRRANGGNVLSASQTKRVNAPMLTCGLYDAAGEFAYRVGLPAKKRCRRRHSCRGTGKMHHQRVEPGTWKVRKFRRWRRRTGRMHQPNRVVHLLSASHFIHVVAAVGLPYGRSCGRYGRYWRCL